MGTKINPGTHDCWRAALPDEPMFILLARDATAPARIREWADERRRALIAALPDGELTEQAVKDEFRRDMAQISDAEEIAHDMIVWRAMNDGAWRVSPTERGPMSAIEPALKEEIAAALARGLCNVLGVGTAQFSIVEHVVKDWSKPGWSVRQHYFRISSVGQLGRLRDNPHPDIELTISGWDVRVGDVFCRWKSDNDARIQMQIMES